MRSSDFFFPDDEEYNKLHNLSTNSAIDAAAKSNQVPSDLIGIRIRRMQADNMMVKEAANDTLCLVGGKEDDSNACSPDWMGLCLDEIFQDLGLAKLSSG